jgi:hypothetical protein
VGVLPHSQVPCGAPVRPRLHKGTSCLSSPSLFLSSCKIGTLSYSSVTQEDLRDFIVYSLGKHKLGTVVERERDMVIGGYHALGCTFVTTSTSLSASHHHQTFNCVTNFFVAVGGEDGDRSEARVVFNFQSPAGPRASSVARWPTTTSVSVAPSTGCFAPSPSPSRPSQGRRSTSPNLGWAKCHAFLGRVREQCGW